MNFEEQPADRHHWLARAACCAFRYFWSYYLPVVSRQIACVSKVAAGTILQMEMWCDTVLRAFTTCACRCIQDNRHSNYFLVFFSVIVLLSNIKYSQRITKVHLGTYATSANRLYFHVSYGWNGAFENMLNSW